MNRYWYFCFYKNFVCNGKCKSPLVYKQQTVIYYAKCRLRNAVKDLKFFAYKIVKLNIVINFYFIELNIFYKITISKYII